MNFSIPKPPDSRLPREIVNLGDHLRKRRIELGLTLEQVGEIIGVRGKNVLCWEQGHNQPRPKRDLALIEFLGYNPFTRPKELGGWMRRLRKRHGMTVPQFAPLLGTNSERLWALERSQRIPKGWDAERLEAFLEKAETDPGWLAQAIETGEPFSHLIFKPPTTVTEQLFVKRQKMGLTQAQIAKAIGVSLPAYVRWETGADTPDHRTLPKIIRFLGYLPPPPEEPNKVTVL